MVLHRQDRPLKGSSRLPRSVKFRRAREKWCKREKGPASRPVSAYPVKVEGTGFIYYSQFQRMIKDVIPACC